MAIGTRYRDMRDTTDPLDAKLLGAVNTVAHQLDDRFPARGNANVRRTNEYLPLEMVSRQNRLTPYRKYPSEKG